MRTGEFLVKTLAVVFVLSIYISCASVIGLIWHWIEVCVHGYAQKSVVDTVVCLHMGIRAGGHVIDTLHKRFVRN